jgi:hypothetical protein
VVDRPDLVARVFRLKKEQMLEEIFKDGIFGTCPARVWTIEYQKRGLPHAGVPVVRVGYHILIGLLPHMKKLLNNSIPCCSLLGLIDPLWLPVGCRSYSEHSGRSDRQMMPTMTTMIIAVWYNSVEGRTTSTSQTANSSRRLTSNSVAT